MNTLHTCISRKLPATLILLLFLASCGGGGSDSDPDSLGRLFSECNPQVEMRIESSPFGPYLDLDGDSDLDMIDKPPGRRLSNSRIFFNDGSMNFIDSGKTISTDGDYIFTHADTDGLVDLVDRAGIFLNNGDGTFVDSGKFIDTSLSDPFQYFEFNLTSDLDRDGDWDIISVSGEYRQMFIYKNDGVGNFSKETPASSGGYFNFGNTLDSTGFELGDIDGDGDQDIVGLLSYYNGHNRSEVTRFINDGTGKFTRVDFNPHDPGIIGGLRLADFDGDGDLDLMLTRCCEYSLDHSTPIGTKYRVFTNDGTGSYFNYFKFNPADLAADVESVEFADIDDDNDIDLVTKVTIGSNRIYCNSSVQPSANQTM